MTTPPNPLGGDGKPGTLTEYEIGMATFLGLQGGLRPKVAWRYSRPLALQNWFSYIRANVWKMVAVGAIGYLIGWAWNVYVMAVRYDGYRVPKNSPVTGTNNIGLQPAVYWVVVPMILSAVVSYVITAGPSRSIADAKSLPRMLKGTFNGKEKSEFWRNLLWGFAGSMLFVVIIRGYISGAAALTLAFLLLTAMRSVLIAGLMMAWRWILRTFVPGKLGSMPSSLTMTVATVGSTAAFAVGYVISDTGIRFFVAIMAFLAAYLLGHRSASIASAAVWLIVAAVAIWWFGLDGVALADDGGKAECGGQWSDWWGCTGSGTVRETAAVAGILSLIGSVTGFAGGAGLASGPGPSEVEPVQWPPLDEYLDWDFARQQRFKKKIMTKWRADNPGADWTPVWKALDGLDNPSASERVASYNKKLEEIRRGQLDRTIDMNEAFVKGVISDITSVDGWKRMGGTAVKTPGKIAKITNETVEGLGFLSGYGAGRTLDDMARKMGEEGLDYSDLPGEAAKALDGAWNKWADELQGAMLSGDEAKVQDMLSDVSGNVSIEVLMGWAAQPGMAGRTAVRESLEATKGLGLTRVERMRMAAKAGLREVEYSADRAKSMRIRPKEPFSKLDDAARMSIDPKTLTEADFQDWLEWKARRDGRVTPRIDPDAPARSLEELKQLPSGTPITAEEVRMLTTVSEELQHDLWDQALRDGSITDLKMAGLKEGQANPRDMWLDGKGYPKPEDIKPKSYRGAKDDAVGITPPPGVEGDPAMWKMPTRPPGGEASPDWGWYKWRLEEYYDRLPKIQQLIDEGGTMIGPDGNEIAFKITVDESGVIRNASDGQPFFGDTDIWGKGRYNGPNLPSDADLSAGGRPRNLSMAEREAAQAADMRLSKGEIQHPGDTRVWMPTSEADQRVKAKVIEGVSKEGYVRVWKNGFMMMRE